MSPIHVTRTAQRLLPNPRRVLAKPFMLGDELLSPGTSRAGLLLARILLIPEADLGALLADLMARFESRHRDLDALLDRHYEAVSGALPRGVELSAARRRLIGAYFTHEYSVEAAALFNPSIVLAPDQAGLAAGQSRFVMSLRAVGEGHISSIELRSGTLEANGELRFEPVGPHLMSGDRTPARHYQKHLFILKLQELQAWNSIARIVIDGLHREFRAHELEGALADLERNGPPRAIWFETARIIRVLAASNYEVSFPADSALAERVLFPAGPNETHGMEDARFVRFVDGESATYYATYTAYDGFQIMPQLIQTDDFVSFAIQTLNGDAAQNKGMALFPRKVGGHYMMLSRKDRENLHLTTSDNVHFWNDVHELYRPSRPWELMQVGNCGSPLETEAGWLVLTHGVGPMREYAIGALLLDLKDPHKVIGALREPLLVPDASEREGYVPNVLYTCGGIIHGDRLVMPYGFSDAGIGVASVSLADILGELSRSPPG